LKKREAKLGTFSRSVVTLTTSLPTAITNMNTTRIPLKNENNGYYTKGCSFPEERWVEIRDIRPLHQIMENNGEYSPTNLSVA